MNKKNVDVAQFIEKNRSLIYGAILGDAYLPGAHGKSTHLVFGHGIPQKEYLFHKYELFKEASYPPYFQKSDHGDSWRFHTVKSVEWQRVWSIFHQDSKKIIDFTGKSKILMTFRREAVLDVLDDHGMALWWMDDGYLNFSWNKKTRQWKETAKLATCGFPAEINQMILQWIEAKYGAKGYVTKQKVQKKNRFYEILEFNWQEFLKIAVRVKPYVIPSMFYKIDLAAMKIYHKKGILGPCKIKIDRESEEIEIPVTFGSGCGSYPA